MNFILMKCYVKELSNKLRKAIIIVVRRIFVLYHLLKVNFKHVYPIQDTFVVKTMGGDGFFRSSKELFEYSLKHFLRLLLKFFDITYLIFSW